MVNQQHSIRDLGVMAMLFVGILLTAVWLLEDSVQAFNIPSEGVEMILAGKDASGRRDCHLFVHQQGRDDQGRYFAKVTTSYSHGNDKPAPITVNPRSQQVGQLYGEAGSERKDQILIFLDPAAEDLRNAKRFHLRWWHIDHAHNYRCLDLKVQ